MWKRNFYYVFGLVWFVCCCCCLVTSVMSDSVQPCGLPPARILCPWDSPGKHTGVGCHALLQGIFPTQGLNPGLLHCRQILYHQATMLVEFKYGLPTHNTTNDVICCLKMRWNWNRSNSIGNGSMSELKNSKANTPFYKRIETLAN